MSKFFVRKIAEAIQLQRFFCMMNHGNFCKMPHILHGENVIHDERRL